MVAVRFLTHADLGNRVSIRVGLILSNETSRYLKFGGATGVILLALGYLAYTGVQESKSYYVTIKELRGMGDLPTPSGCASRAMFSPDRSSAMAQKLSLF